MRGYPVDSFKPVMPQLFDNFRECKTFKQRLISRFYRLKVLLRPIVQFIRNNK